LKIQVSANRKRTSDKVLIYSIVEINTAGDSALLAYPWGAKLENQSSVAILDKGITII